MRKVHRAHDTLVLEILTILQYARRRRYWTLRLRIIQECSINIINISHLVTLSGQK